MAFTPRTFSQIFQDMYAFVRMQTNLTDFEVGAVIRSMLEAAALEDDEQYYQMVQLLDSFDISTASGQDLIDRLKSFNVQPLEAASSTGTIYIANGNLPSSLLAYSAAIGATAIIVDDSSLFPTAGYPYTVRIGEGTISVMDVAVSNNDTSTGTFTLNNALTKSFDITELGDVRVSLVDGSDIIINTGVRVQVPATSSNSSITFVGTTTGIITEGNYASTPITVRCETPGVVGNVGSNKITQFAAAPFDGAVVYNRTPTNGGRENETDAELRGRGLQHIQSLSRGNVTALKNAAIGVTDPVTGQRVTTASIFEDFKTDEVIVYIDDGTGFIPDVVTLPITTLTSGILSAETEIPVTSLANFPTEGYILLSPDNTSQTEVLPYNSLDITNAKIVTTTGCVYAHDSNDSVLLVDVLSESTEGGERFFQLSSIPVIRNSIHMYMKQPGLAVSEVFENTDYYLDKSTGNVEFIEPLPVGTLVCANYSYYTGLVATVQKVLSGDQNDPVSYPGIAAKGIHTVVETPTIRRVNVRVSFSAMPGYQQANLSPTIQESLEAYVNSLEIGEDVIIAEIIRRCMEVSGVKDVSVVLPTTNVVVLENELPRAVDGSGNSLVIVN